MSQEPGLPTPGLQDTLAFPTPPGPEASLSPGPLSTAWSPVVGPRLSRVRAWKPNTHLGPWRRPGGGAGRPSLSALRAT